MYSRKLNNKTYQFGVSGLLYKSNILMYDKQSESLWSQVMQEAVTGQMTGTKLHRLPSTLTTWEKWRSKHPETDVLTPATGYVRDYSKDPYESYYKSRSGLFGFLKGGPGAEDKEIIVGVVVNETAKAYKLSDLKSSETIKDAIAGRDITLTFDEETDKITTTEAQGGSIDHLLLYWFIWKSIYPDAEVY